ncbi:MAG TPA: GHKL domain-containing protein [Campylobacterales bacterium]|nr:GHKL domain-containing protein [Campylobacterales bacterium]
MFKRIVYLHLFLFSLLQAGTLNIGEKARYDLLEYYEYSVAQKLNDTPQMALGQSWDRDKQRLHKEPHHAYWIRFRLENPTTQTKELYMIMERNYVALMEYYQLKNGEVTYQGSEGFYRNFDTTPFNSSLRTLPITLGGHEDVEVLLKVQNFNRVDVPLKLVTKDYLIDHYQTYSLLQGMFFGIMLIMMLYNAILYFLVRYKPYLLYVGYVFFVMIYFAAYHGYLHRYIGLNPQYIYIFLGTSAIGFVVFVTYFMGQVLLLGKHFPRLYKSFKPILGYFVLLAGGLDIAIYMESFAYAQFFFTLLSGTLPLYAVMLLYTLYALAHKQVSQFALAYAMSWTVIAIVGVALMGVHLGIVPVGLGVDYLFQGAMACEAVLFSVILAYRLRELEEEKKEQQARLVHQNRLTSMGEVVSNIAHQWRQPLSEINGRVLTLDMLYRQENLTPEVLDRHLNGIEEVTEYLSTTINDFMNFFDTKKALQLFEISELLDKAFRIANVSAMAHGVALVNTFKDQGELRGYPSELLQAVLIVMHNAMDACRENHVQNPTIIVSIEQESQYLTIAIADNGGGIPPAIIDSIFDPYFSTKHQKKGVGLGLYILKMIVERNMQGEVTVSNHHSGAKFSLKIPKYFAQK